MKKSIFIILIAAAAQLLASDEQRITVNGYTVDSGVFVVHGVAAGKPVDLLCDKESPYCSVPEPGEYRIVDWTVPVIAFQGTYTCKEVDLYTEARNGNKGRKLGEYCLVERHEQ